MTQSSSPSSSPSSPETQTTEGKFRKELEILQRKYINQHNQSNQGVIVAKLVNRNNTELGIPLGHCNIGKSDNCTIQLITESVSDYHACFHSEGKNFFIMDTASTNGTGLSVSPGADFIELKNGFFYQIKDGNKVRFAGESFKFHVLEDSNLPVTNQDEIEYENSNVLFSDHDELDESLNHIPQSMEFQTLSIKKSDDPMNEDESSIYHSLSNKTDRVINDHSPSNNGDISAGNQSENRTNTDDENLEDISNSPQLVDDSAPHTRDDILSGDFMNVVNPVSNLHDEIIDHDDTPKGSLKITSQNGFHVQNENDAIFAENSFNGIHANDHVDDSIEELNEEIEYVADSIGSNFDGGVECDGVIEQIEIMQQDVGDEDREGSSEPIDTVMAQEKVNYENVPEPMDTVMIEENNNQENVVISEPIDGGNDLLNADATTQPAELMNVDESLVIPNELKNDELQDGKPTFYLAEDSIDSKLEKSNDTREMETNEFVPVDDEMLNANIDYSLKITKSHQSEIAEESRDNSILPDERSPENEKLLPTVKKSSKKSRKSDTQIPEILKSSKKVKLEESIEVDQPTKVAKPKKNRLAKDLKSDIKEDALFSNIDDASKKSDVDIPSSDSKSKSTISNDNQASNSKKPHVIKSSNILDESPPQDDRNAPRPALKTFKRSSRKSKKNEQQVEIVEEELNEGKKSKFEVLVEPISSKRSKSTKTNISEIALDTPYIVVADTSKRASRSRKDDALKLEPKTDEKSNDKANSSPIAPRKIEEVVPIPRRSLNKNALVDLFEKRLPEEIAPAPKKSSKKSLTPIASRSSEPTYRITFTGILSTELPKKSQILVKYGASIVDNWVDCTHLVSDKVRRTTKFLCALSCGKHIMDLKWTEACKKQGKILEETKYILNDPASEELYGFKLTESLELARQNGTVLFKGITVYTTPSVQPKRDDLKEIIDAAGGSHINAIPKLFVKDLIIVGNLSDTKECSALEKLGYHLYSSEFLFTNILRQQLEYDSFLLSPKSDRKRLHL